MTGNVFQINGLCIELSNGFVYKTVDIINGTEVYRVARNKLEELITTFLTDDVYCIVGFHFGSDPKRIELVSCFSNSILQLLPIDCDYLFLIVINHRNVDSHEFSSVLSSLRSFALGKETGQAKEPIIDSIEKQLFFLGCDICCRKDKDTYSREGDDLQKANTVILQDTEENEEEIIEFSANALSKKIVPLISSLLDVRFLPAERSRKAFCDPSNSFGMIVSSSKQYSDISRDYWFAIRPSDLEKIDSCDRKYLVFGCQHSPNDLVFLIPMDVVKDKIPTMRPTLTPEGKVDHWHVDFNRDRNGDLCWVFPGNYKLVLSNYLIND